MVLTEDCLCAILSTETRFRQEQEIIKKGEQYDELLF